ncbi:MAG: MarP family serine protease, partial [Acidimicrobiales bacterium]
MDFLDAILIVVLVGAAAHGLRVGAAVQVATIVGVLAGVTLGVVLIVNVGPHLSGTATKTLAAILFLLIPASVFGGIGRQGGVHLWRAIRRIQFGHLDALAGLLFAVAGMGVVLWLFASAFVNAPSTLLANEIENSAILRGIDTVMPPVPDAFARIDAYLAESGFPQVVVGLVPGPSAKVPLATRAEVTQATRAAAASTVKVISIGCNEEIEGSGFEVPGGLVVTNAHVIAGSRSITVYAPNGRSSRAVPVLFDSRFDLAVLRIGTLGIPALSVDDGYVSDGKSVVFLGYPEDGPLREGAAGVVARFTAEGRDIYDEALAIRQVYEIHGFVEPGNSGGPLVTPSGKVLGVVFSRSTSRNDIGFALTSPGVEARITEAQQRRSSVST